MLSLLQLFVAVGCCSSLGLKPLKDWDVLSGAGLLTMSFNRKTQKQWPHVSGCACTDLFIVLHELQCESDFTDVVVLSQCESDLSLL